MRVYITGATGFVGSNLADYYYTRGHIVKSHIRSKDITAELGHFQPDVVVNCAAEIYDAEKMFEPNIMLTYKILEYVKASKCRMVQIGSSSEYGPTEYASSEETLLKPVDFYQGTKGAATLLCQGWARAHNLKIYIARPYSVFGPGERPHRLFPHLWRAFKYQEPMNLYEGYHDFIYVHDFLRGIDMLARLDNIPPGEIYNFGSGVQTSNKEVLQLFEKVTQRTAPVTEVFELKKSFESRLWKCDTSKAKQFGFTCDYSLEEGISYFLMKAHYDRKNTQDQ